MNGVIETIYPLEDLGVLIDWVTEIVKHKRKKEGECFGLLLIPFEDS